MSVQTVLFDLGRVVIDWNPDRLYQKLIADLSERRHFLTHICTMNWHVRHDAGMSFAENADLLTAQFPEHEDLIRAWGARWEEMFNGYISGTPELLDRLDAANIPLYALTNLPSEAWPPLQLMYPRMSLFRDVIVSGDEKCVKPDPTIFKIALSRMGNPSPETVFFTDDSPANIEAAAKLGFVTHLFEHANGLESALIDHKLIS